MSDTEWNDRVGELRSALEHRNWHRAGAVVWQLRQLDAQRYNEQLDAYTRDKVREGGYSMALETEQRLEAVRQWAQEALAGEQSEDWRECFEKLLAGESREHAQPVTSYNPIGFSGRLDYSHALACVGRPYSQNARLKSAEFLRQDMADVIWSIMSQEG